MTQRKSTPTTAPTLRLAPELELPQDAVTETLAILGNRGAGKTNTAVVYVEELLKAAMQVCIVDPTDVWWGLKSSRDGTGPGFPVVICGGRKADVPIDAADGTTIADFIVESGASVVLALRHLSQNAERRFVTDLCNRLYYLKGQHENPTPLAVIFDEAGRVVPQRVSDGPAALCVGAVQQLVRQGRSSGFGIVLIDQRPATVNKEVLELLEMMIVHRVTGPLNRKTLKGWIESQANDEDGKGKDFLEALPTLPKGEAWVWSPGWLDIFKRVKMRERETFDSSYTPKPGEKRTTPTKVAEVDLAALKQKLASAIERARADDPEVLRARIAELEATVAQRDIVTGTITREEQRDAIDRASELEQAVAHGIEIGESTERLRWRERLTLVVPTLKRVDEDIKELIAYADSVVASEAYGATESAPTRQPPALPARKHVERPIIVGTRGPVEATITERPRRSTQAPKNREGDVKQRIINALAFFAQFGQTQPTRAQIGAYLQYHPRTPTLLNPLKELEAEGAVVLANGTIAATGQALRRAKLADDEIVRNNRDAQRVWRSKLGEIESAIVDAVIAAPKHVISRLDMAAMLGYHVRTPTFLTPLKRLETMNLVTLPTGMIKATNVLFPFGGA